VRRTPTIILAVVLAFALVATAFDRLDVVVGAASGASVASGPA